MAHKKCEWTDHTVEFCKKHNCIHCSHHIIIEDELYCDEKKCIRYVTEISEEKMRRRGCKHCRHYQGAVEYEGEKWCWCNKKKCSIKEKPEPINKCSGCPYGSPDKPCIGFCLLVLMEK